MTNALRLVPALVLVVLASCASQKKDWVETPYDPVRARAGDVFISTVATPDGRLLIKAIAMVDAPREHLLNMLEDLEAWPQWSSLLSEVKLVSRDGDVAVVDAVPTVAVVRKLVGALRERVRMDRARGEYAITAEPNAVLESATTLYKVTDAGQGRTLLSIYGIARPRNDIMERFGPGQPALMARLVKDIRASAPDPRWAHPPPAAAPSQRARVLVTPMKVDGLPAEDAVGLTRVLAMGLMASPALNVLTQEEAVALVDHARARELAGCTGEDACTVDVARLLEAQRLVQSSLGRVGRTYVMHATLIALPEGTVLRRAAREAADLDAMLDGARALAAELAAP